MRRVIGLSLAGLGTFLIVCAIVLPTYIVSQVIKFPLNEYETATLDATGASYFDASTLSERSPVNLQATYTIKGDGGVGTSSMAVWNEFSYVKDLTNNSEVQIQTRTFAFDRKTGELLPYSGDSLNGKPLPQTGGLGYVFPLNTQQKTYQWFDTSLDKAVPMVFTGTTTVDGIQCDVFTETVSPTQVATQSVPGSMIGSSAATVTAPEMYSIHFVYDVDPVTGAPLDVNEHEVQALYNPATNQPALTLFNADLIATPASVTQIVGLDKSGRNELTILKTILPITLGALGAVCLIVGIWLVARRPHEDVEAGPTTPAPELAAVPDPGEPEVTAEAASAETHSPSAESAQVAEPAPVAEPAKVAEAAPAGETLSAPVAADAPPARTATVASPVAEPAVAEPAVPAPAEGAAAAEAVAASPADSVEPAASNGEAPSTTTRRTRRAGGSHAKPRDAKPE